MIEDLVLFGGLMELVFGDLFPKGGMFSVSILGLWWEVVLG